MSESPRQRIEFRPFHILSDADVVYFGEVVVQLGPRAAQVLRYLAENHDRVVSKEELLEKLWPDVFTTDAVLKKAVLQARRALDDDARKPRFIETHHGRGYRFIAPVVISSADTALPATVANTITRVRSGAQKSPSGYPDYDQLVGREQELAMLRAEYQRTIEGRGRPVLITGESGIGKTQLARRFSSWASLQGAACVYARFFDYKGSRLAPHEVFLDLLREALASGVKRCRGDDEFDLRQLAEMQLRIKLPEQLFAEVSPSPRPSPIDGNGGGYFRAIVPLSQCFVRLSRKRPLVMVLDDLQWADQISLELVGYLMRTAQSEPLMLIALARTEAGFEGEDPLDEWLKLQANYGSYTTLALEPLDEESCAAAIGAVFGESADTLQVPARDLRTLQQATGGNPYFLTEILRLLVAQGAISHEHGRTVWAGIGDLRLPGSLVMAARAKLDRLPRDVRDIVEQASVIGDEFRVETLLRMVEKSEQEVEQSLETAVRFGVLSECGLSAGEDFRFYHTILRRVLYEGLSPRRRRRLHANAARAIEFVYSRESDRVASAIGVHCEAAGEPLPAFTWSMRAWQAARNRWDWNEAVASVERAQRALGELERLAETDVSPTDRLGLLVGLGEGYCSVGRLRESQSVVAEAVSLAESLDDKTQLAAALIQQGLTEMGLGLHRDAIRSTNRALEVSRGIGDQTGVTLAVLQLGTIQVATGDYEKAAQLIEQSLKDIPGDSHLASRAFGILGWARVLQGLYSEGVPALERALDYYGRVRDVRQQANVLGRLQWAHLTRGRYEQAIGLARRARDLFRAAGDTAGEARMIMSIGQARVGQGLYEEGVERLSQALKTFQRIGNAHLEAESLWLLGRAHLEAGRLEEASLLLKTALEMVQKVCDRDDEFRVMTDLARLKIAQGDSLAAIGAADQALELAEELHNRHGVGVALVERARACLALNQPHRALEAAEGALDLLDETESGQRWRAH